MSLKSVLILDALENYKCWSFNTFQEVQLYFCLQSIGNSHGCEEMGTNHGIHTHAHIYRSRQHLFISLIGSWVALQSVMYKYVIVFKSQQNVPIVWKKKSIDEDIVELPEYHQSNGKLFFGELAQWIQD